MTDYNIKGGVQCADFIGGDKNITYGFTPEDVERLIEKVLAMMQAGGVFQPAPDQQDALQIEYNGEKLVFRQGAISQLSNQGQERAYLLALIVDQEIQRWATRFVPLAGKMDIHQGIESLSTSFTEFIIPAGEAGGQATQRPLKDITEAMQSHRAFVILGEPGSGKTTIQQKIAFESALALLKGAEGKIPLFVRLSQQGERDPYSFLQVEWERRTGLPFARALAQGRILILADGINDIPRDKRNERLLTWINFEKAYLGSNQLIFSGRARDYDNDLNLPRVLVEPLDKARIHDFLVKHKAEGLAKLLDDPASSLGEMASNPLNLFVLVMVYHKGGRNLQVLANRGRLFESFSWELMSHEQKWHRDAFSVDSKIELFARLAYDMQKQGSGTTFDLESAQSALPKQVLMMGEPVPVDSAAVFRFGRGASILDPLTLPDVRFYHHLLQEYFAARELLKRFSTGEDLSAFWKTPRTKEEMPAAEVSEWDALPEPPATGWEVTTILACGLSQDAQKLIEAIRLINPALAGRCLNEAGIATKDWGVRKRVQADLLADIYNPKLHLRTRLQAGFTLGHIGDPRFEAKEVNGVQVVLPQIVNVPAGKYFIGSVKSDQNSYEQEYPQHTVELPAFSIGKWSVTNAEFACFMNAGGYENKKYWQGNLAKRWLNGEDVSGGQMKSYMELLKYFHDNPNWKTTFETSGNYSPQQIESYEYIAGLTEDELKEQLGKLLSQKSRSQPEYWKDRERNNPSQPVVGITWFEANAYCAWLSEITGKQYSLPSEVKWEAAARDAGNSRKYPWGEDWDKERTNSIEGRVMKSSPVGVYTAAGAMGPFGAEDQVDNVYEWTSSLFLPYPYNAEKSELKESNTECVVRGGAWDSPHRDARCTYRSGHPYDYFATNIGFRICATSTESTNINPVDFRFRQFIKQIEPSRQKREEVNQIIDSLRSRLIRPSDDIYQKIELFGSFARDTSIESLFDVDLLVYFGEKLASESPKEAYDMLASTLRQIYKTKLIDPSLMRKGQIINPGLGRNDQSRINPSSFGGSLNVKLDTVNLEILPAIESKSQKGILVPDSRLIRWIPTNHLKHQEFTEKMDNATGGIYRSVVKSMKWWLYYQSPKWRILSGFAIECLIGTYFSSKPDNAINEFKLILQRIRKEHTSYLTLRTVNELGVPNGKKPTGITQKRFATFESLIDATLIVLKDIEKVNSSEKLILLGKIFGQSFSEFDGEIPQQTSLTSVDFPKLGNLLKEKVSFSISNSTEVRSNQQEQPLKEKISSQNIRRTLPPSKRERPPKPELPKPVDKEVSKLEYNDVILGVVETDAGAGKKVSLILPNGGKNDRAIIPAGTSSINRYKKGGKVLLEVRKIEGNSQIGFRITCHPIDL
jgi:formylglycine-generating enzyme required for sulfatase activity/predicted nucleotidyltransferase